MSNRIQKINELLKEEVAKIIFKEIENPELELLTVTKAEISSDLKKATIWVTSLKDVSPVRLLNILNGKRTLFLIQKFLAKTLTLKFIPKIEFKIDTSYEDIQKIENLLKEIHGE